MTSKAQTPRGKKPNRISPSRIVVYSILFVAAVYYLLPLYVMVITSLKDGGFRYLMAGVRASVGAKAGRYMFEVKILEVTKIFLYI